MPSRHRRRSRLSMRALGSSGALLGLVCLTLAVLPGSAAAATTHTVSGTLYWDQDNDGVHDLGEPGVAGVRVHSSAGKGTPTTVTDASGHYVLTGVPQQAAGALTVETGWFRSQCAALSCAAGPGPDNDVPTSNQFIKYPLASLTTDVDGLDVGLLPDWPGSAAAAPSPVDGVVPANAVDVAARLSWVTDSCPGGSIAVCRVGDTFTVSGQVHNQGTLPLTGIAAVLALPATDRFVGVDPTTAVTLTTTATSPGITGVTVSDYDAVRRSLRLTFHGTLVPGGLIKVTAKATVTNGPGTPGCVLPSPQSACPAGEPNGAALLFAVTHVDQSGDLDSFGPGCDADTDVTLCPTGIHDKQVEPDEVDAVGHDVDAALTPTSDFDLVGRADLLAGGSPAPSSPQSVRVSVTNTGPTVVLKGWITTTVFPLGTAPVVPVPNAARSCKAATTTMGYPAVRCTGKAPLSPGVTTFATDVSFTVPGTASPGALLWVLTFVQPPTPDGETLPAGTPPTVPGDASATATNNDASVALVVAGP